MIVTPEPQRCVFVYLVDRPEQILIEPVIAGRSVVTLDIGVLLRLAPLDILIPDLVLLGPDR